MAHILLAEDDLPVRDFVYRILQMDGHEVVGAHEGQEALRNITSAGDQFDLFLCDIQMPVIDGVTLSQLVFRHVPRLPILLMTGYSTQDFDEHVPSVIGVLQKPFTVNGMQEAVRSGLGRMPMKSHRAS